MRPSIRSFASLGAAAIALAITIPRVCPTVAVLGDSAVMTAASVAWGVPQPPGYPLFVLAGHLASLVPVFDVAWRVNVTSALFHAATVAVVADTVTRATRTWIAGLAAGLFLAFSRRFFFGSLYAEVFPLNDLMTSAAFAVALAIERRRAGRGEVPFSLLAAFALVAAVASGHHQMISLAAPGLAVLVGPPALRTLRERPRRIVALAAAFVVVVASAYALVLVAASRDPASSWGDVHDVPSLVRLFLRDDYGGPASAALVADRGHAIDRVALFVTSTWSAFGALGVGLGILGVAAAWRASRRCAVAVLLGFVATGPVFAAMNAIPVADAHGAAFLERFFTMADVLFALLVGFGVAEAIRLSTGRAPRAAAAILGMVWLAPLLANAAECDLGHDRTGDALVRDLVRPLPPGSLVLVAGDDLVGAAAYACAAMHACDRSALFSPGQLHLAWRTRQLARRHPEVVLAPRGDRPPSTREMVEDNLSSRAVFVSASLLDLDPSLRELPAGFLPQGILVRVVDEESILRERDAFIAESRAMLRGEACEGCAEGLFSARTIVHALEERAVGIDETALVNHARVLRHLLSDPGDADALEERAAALRRTREAAR